ncbi:MAG: flotillin-like FloA family protein, partial [Clostridia bacterium]|nr:flotillin-like FloA family protein [Clostridia bacterium]
MNLLLEASSQIWIWIVVGVILFFIIILFAIVPVNLWFRCLVSGTYVGIFKLVGMKLRKVNANMVIDAYINAKKAGLDINIDDLETHAMAGGNVNSVVAALISAHSAKINLPVEVAKAIDLAGRDVLKAVKESVTPKVIKTPVISAMAKNGIELRVLAKVTVKTNLNKLVGGAGEETIISRVGEGIVTTIGSSETHQQVLENPDSISKVVLEKGLDDGTAFQILSIDIADIDVGDNIGAELKKSQAQAEKEIAQAKAEER